jgi:hypothetical protein
MTFIQNNSRKLFLVKLLHTLIWAFFASVIGFIVYAGLWNRMNTWVWIAVGLIIVEGVILLLHEWKCPLTPIAARYTESREDNFDIFLPRWLARNNKSIFTLLYVFGVAIVLYRALT